MASTLTVDNIVGATTANKIHIPGGVIQVIQAIRTDADSESLAVGAFSAAILSAAITPQKTTSKILVLCNLHITTGTATAGSAALLRRGGTDIGIGDASGSAVRATGGGFGGAVSNRMHSNIAMTILDSPSTTSEITYTAHGKHGYNTTQLLYWNREQVSVTSGANSRVSSTLTLMVIGQ